MHNNLILSVLFSITLSSSAIAASLSSNDRILATQFITAYDTHYSFVLTKHQDSSNIKAYIYNNSGDKQDSYSYGVINGISNAYLLPVDSQSNQNVRHVLVFLETTSGLQHIINTTINAGTLQSFEIINITNKPNMVSVPQLIPRDPNNHFLVIPYPHSIGIYSYIPNNGMNFLSLLGNEVNFGTEEVVQIVPVRGFIIAVTNVPKAYFIGLEDHKIFKTYGLTSDQGIFLAYDETSKKTYLKSSSDTTEIGGAPMPYGIISMHRQD